jgi:hypothetical protein
LEPYFGAWRSVTVDIFMSVAMAEELFKKSYKIRHNVPQEMRDTTYHRNSFFTPKGKSTQAFFDSLIIWLFFPTCKKSAFAFHGYYGNDKADSEQNYKLEAALLYTE